MSMNSQTSSRPYGRSNRRSFLADFGMGFTGLALGSMLHRDGITRAAEAEWSPPDGRPIWKPQAKSVIWIFLSGRDEETAGEARKNERGTCGRSVEACAAGGCHGPQLLGL